MKKEKQQGFNLNNKWLIVLILFALIAVTLLTKYYGSTDIGDYSDVSKYFSGQLASKIRSSHSYLYGFIHAPFVKLLGNFFVFKISSLIFLLLIIYSVYIISNKNKKSLWLILLCPVIWYMAPWISPIQLASLFFLWAYYFITKFDKEEKIKYLLYSGIFLGLAWAFWDTILFFAVFLSISFFYNKKLSHFFIFIVCIFIGLAPRLILDSVIFNFPLYTILKSSLGTIANIFGGIYNKEMFEQASSYFSSGFSVFISLILAIPACYWLLYKPDFFKKNKKVMIFLSLSVILILINPQIRYVLLIAPIIIVLIGKNISKKIFILQILVSAFIILLFINPYIIQIKYSIDKQNYADFTYILEKGFKISISNEFEDKLIIEDIEKITQEYENETFIVGNHPDVYQRLARIYWSNNIEEFVSIQDYQLYLNNETVIFEKKFMPVPKIADRRQIWIAGGINKNQNDNTDYSSIKYALSLDNNFSIQNFKPVKKYNLLTLYEKQ